MVCISKRSFLKIKRGDTAPALCVQLGEWVDGSFVLTDLDLTDCVFTFYLQKLDDLTYDPVVTEPVLRLPGTLVSNVDKSVVYEWKEINTINRLGFYDLELEVIFPNGVYKSWPTEDRETIVHFVEDIDDRPGATFVTE